jgi:hypothetical protein
MPPLLPPRVHHPGRVACLALFLVVFGARLHLVDRFGSSVPFLDQWNGEASAVYLPYLNGTLGWADLFTAHNEHRPVLTRLEGLVLLVADGQWNPLLQMVVNATIIAVAATMLAYAIWTLAGRRHLAVIVIAVAICFAAPHGWENTLAGFQSQFYYLNLAAFTGLWAVPLARPGSPWWVLGVFALGLGLLSLATGFVAPLATALVVIVRDGLARNLGRETLVTAAVALTIAIGGLALVPEAPAYLAAARSGTFAARVVLGARSLAWPFTGAEWMVLVMWAPAMMLAVHVLRTRRVEPVTAYLSGLSAWVIAHALGLAWARGGAMDVPASRYMDILAVGAVVNAVACVLVRERARLGAPYRAATWGAAVWFVVVAAGVWGEAGRAMTTGAPVRHAWTTAYARNIRQLAEDHDLGRFGALTFPDQVPWINARDLALIWLYDPRLRPVLPPSIRDPEPGMPPRVAVGPLGRVAEHATRLGRPLMVLGLLLAGLAGWLGWRSATSTRPAAATP